MKNECAQLWMRLSPHPHAPYPRPYTPRAVHRSALSFNGSQIRQADGRQCRGCCLLLITAAIHWEKQARIEHHYHVLYIFLFIPLTLRETGSMYSKTNRISFYILHLPHYVFLPVYNTSNICEPQLMARHSKGGGERGVYPVVHVRDRLALNPIRLEDDIREFEMPIKTRLFSEVCERWVGPGLAWLIKRDRYLLTLH